MELLNITRGCIFSAAVGLLLLSFGCKVNKTTASAEPYFSDADKSEKIYGEFYSVYIHGDTLSFLQYSARFVSIADMYNLYSMKVRMNGDTIVSANSSPCEIPPLSVNWRCENFDSVVYSDRTPSDDFSKTVLKHIAFPTLLETSKAKEKTILTDPNIFSVTQRDGISKMRLSHRVNLSNLQLLFWGLKLNLNNYKSEKEPNIIDPTSADSTLQIDYNIEHIFNSMKFVVRGDSIEVFDWNSHKLCALKEDTTMLKQTYYKVGNQEYIKRFNFSCDKSNNQIK